MTDIYHEIQDDLRRDRLKAIWTRFGTLIVAVAVVIVAAVGGWRAYGYYQGQVAAAAGDRFQAATQLAADGKTDEARAAFAALAKDGPAGYRALATLREAAEASDKDPAAALKLYETVAGDASADALLRDAARVRGGYLGVDHAPRDAVRSLVEPLAAETGPWRHAAREILGLASYKAKDFDDARKRFEALVADAEAPAAARQRANLMLAVLPAPAAAPKTN